MDRYLVIINTEKLNDKSYQAFKKLIGQDRFKKLVIKSGSSKTLMRVQLFDYLEFDLLNAKYAKQLRFSLMKRNYKTSKYAIDIPDCKAQSDDYQALLRKIRL